MNLNLNYISLVKSQRLDSFFRRRKMSGGEKETAKGGDQICCLTENGERCRKPSGNASFNFRVQKLVEQRKLKFSLDSAVSGVKYCMDVDSSFPSIAHF